MSFSLTVAFRDHHVLVEADDSRVMLYIATGFRSLLAKGSCRSQARLRLQRVGEDFEVTLEGERLFAHPNLREAARLLRHEVVDSFVTTHSDLLWLHAGAAALDGRAALFVGPYGHGKSTLVTHLCQRGWTYLSDDIVPVDLRTGRVIPFPLTPFVRDPVDAELPRDRLGELSKRRVDLPRSSYHHETVPIGAVVLPAYRAGAETVLEPYSPAAIALDVVREGINTELMGAAAVALCARLVNEVPVLPITFSDAEAATELIVRTLDGEVAPSFYRGGAKETARKGAKGSERVPHISPVCG